MLKFEDIHVGNVLRFTVSEDTSVNFHNVEFEVIGKSGNSLDIKLVTAPQYGSYPVGQCMDGIKFYEDRFERVITNPADLLFS